MDLSLRRPYTTCSKAPLHERSQGQYLRRPYTTSSKAPSHERSPRHSSECIYTRSSAFTGNLMHFLRRPYMSALTGTQTGALTGALTVALLGNLLRVCSHTITHTSALTLQCTAENSTRANTSDYADSHTAANSIECAHTRRHCSEEVY